MIFRVSTLLSGGGTETGHPLTINGHVRVILSSIVTELDCACSEEIEAIRVTAVPW